MKSFLILIVLFCSFSLCAQNISKKEKIKRELKLLANYSLMDRTQKIETCKDLLFIWFDTSRYDVKMVHNQEGDPYEYKKLNLRIASVVENKTNRYDKKLVFFESLSGKISKVVDFKKENPYSKSKEPLLDENLRYTSEYMQPIPKIDKNGNRLTINKFISSDGGIWRGKYMNWCFRKYALTEKNKVIDEWNTIMIFDTLGNTVIDHEFNGHNFGYEINDDRSYFVIQFGNELLNERGEFYIYEVKNMEKIYSYRVEKEDAWLNGAGFAKNSNNFVGAIINFPTNKYPNPEERLIIDIRNRMEYKYLFSGEQADGIYHNWNTKYKSLENLLNYFEFAKRKF